MSTAITHTGTLLGLDAKIIIVEADVTIGLGGFNIVGLPDGAIKESKDRIIAALNNSGDGFPIRRVVVNLAPADLKKIGSGFDLPMALTILAAMGGLPPLSLRKFFIVGELSLEGNIRPIHGTLAMALAAKEAGFTDMIVPAANGSEAGLVEGINVHTAEKLKQVVRFFSQNTPLPLVESAAFQPTLASGESLCFSDVKGQQLGKRALEIAAAGNHNILFFGPPGSGKTMLARRLPSILPSLSFDEALEVTKIHSVAKMLHQSDALLSERPFRNPHHTISTAGMIGGGSFPRPGEVSLAHHGVLFLDEMPEFPRNILESLRQATEDKRVTISRANLTVQFPTDFLLQAAMNPCPCGYLGDSKHHCSCSAGEILRYRAKISGPLLDRIDMHIEMPNISYRELTSEQKGEKSEVIRQRVMRARNIQNNRYLRSNSRHNSGMSRKELEKYCHLDANAHKMLEAAFEKMNLSNRAHDRILKVARTIADLENSPDIQINHLAEAINYRCLDRPINF